MAQSGIVLGAVSPHPPIVVPEIGEDDLHEVRRTRDGLQQMAGLVRDLNPDTVVIVSPHGPVLRDAITLLSGPILEGNFREFGVAGTSLRYGNDTRLVSRTVQEAAGLGVNVVAADPHRASAFRFPAALHYSVLVPLYYLKQAGVESRLVAGAVGLTGGEAWYRFGQAVATASAELGVRAAYIASGDLSHRLTESAPAGYDPLGKVFDQTVVEALARADAEALMNLDPELVDRAGECGLGPIITLFGALDGLEVIPQVISYEGPYGVGYCVATYVPKGPAARRQSPRKDGPTRDKEGANAAGPTSGPAPTELPGQGHSFVRLARLSLETYVREGRKIKPPPGSPGRERRAGAFVSLKKHGELRGCIGTIEAAAPSLAEEVVHNAIQSGTADPRFQPVHEEELADLAYSVDVLEPAEPVASLEDLNPKIYGVIVAKGRRTGVLLPDLDGIEAPEDQVAIAAQKAGIRPDETGVNLYRFKVTRYR